MHEVVVVGASVLANDGNENDSECRDQYHGPWYGKH